MSTIISQNKNYKAISIGSLNELSSHNFLHPKLGHVVESKVFVGKDLESTATEISFRDLPAKTTIDFLHKHVEHEEIYIVIKGNGKFQVDEDVFEINEGTIVRVDPVGARTLSNTSDSSMIYMVIQAQAGSIKGHDIEDGARVKGEIKNMINLTKVHHIAIICSNYKKSLEFYTETLGLELRKETFRKERNSYKADLYLNNNYIIELFSFNKPPARVTNPEAAGLRHLAFEVDDIDIEIQKLNDLNVKTEPIRTDELTGKRFTFFFDPDKLPIEIYEK